MKQPEFILPVAFSVSATGKIQDWSLNCAKLLGYSDEEVLHRSMTRLFHPAYKNEMDDRLQSDRREAERVDAELVCADGKILSISITFLPRFSSRGVFKGYVVIVGPPQMRGVIMRDARLERLLDCLPGMFYVVDRSGRFLLWNRRLEQVAQMRFKEVQAARVLDLFDDRGRSLKEQKLREAFEHGYSSGEADLVAKDGKRTPYLFHGARVELDGKIYVCGMGLDISERKQHEETLHLYERALQASVNAIVITRHEGKENPIVYVNPAFELITGYRREEVLGRDSRFMRAPGLDEDERARLRAAIDQQRDVQVVFRNRRKNGELFWNELRIAPVSNAERKVTHFVGVISDVTLTRNYQAQLEYEANHDPLTKLANRNLLQDRLDQATSYARRHNSLVAVVYIDLDNFKPINDSLGHDAGDTVLKTVSTRLKSCVRDSDTVARVGGDEFLLVLVDQPSVEYVADLIERVRESIAQRIPVNDQELFVSASIGVSMFPHDASNTRALMQAADTAMYQAKMRGRNNCQFYAPDMNATAHDRLTLEASLRRAIEQGELFLVYLPKVDLKSAKMVGAEALVRWKHPVYGVLLPSSFIPIAEETGLVSPLGEWVLTDACRLMKHFDSLGFHNLTVSLNLSTRQFRQKNFAAFIADKLNSAGLSHDRLGLEISETQLMTNPGYATKVLSELKEIGVEISIDDFGIGYSSLNALKRFPMDHIKLDRSFVRELTKGGDDATVARAVISLGHSLNVKVIAEGVETIEQLEFLRAYQCDQIQGNYFSAPLSEAQLQALLEAKTTLRFR